MEQLAWEKETGADINKTNVNGGAIAVGHPLGASGAILMNRLLFELERRDLRYGLETMCCGGGIGTAVCHVLADMGAKIAVAGRTDQKARATAEALKAGGHETFSTSFDVVSVAETERVVDEAVRRARARHTES